ncbi:arginyl-tRNA synthetase [Syncephalis fuscata]|nr:arginyl-tRNA synthetase [Syncephalis fuscata]
MLFGRPRPLLFRPHTRSIYALLPRVVHYLPIRALTRVRLHSTMPLTPFKEAIAQQLAEFASIDQAQVIEVIEAPRVPEHGDFAVAMPRLRVKGNPAALAKEYAEKFVPNDLVVSAKAIGIFLNFSVEKSALSKLVLKQVVHDKETYGHNKLGNDKVAIVEFSSPNIAKPFHAGHLRSTIIGNFVNNILKAHGYKTITMNYLGDWGKQYGLMAIAYNKYGNEQEMEKDAMKHLYSIYVQINADAEQDSTIHDQAREYFRRMEDGDEEALSLWRRFRGISIEQIITTYDRLNVKFDVYSGESQVKEGMAIGSKILEEKGLLVDSEGAKIIDLSEYKLGISVVQKRDGTTLYITRDIGAAIERYNEYKFDEMYYIVASQQDLHLKQLFKTLELMDIPWAKTCHHINFGMVSGMSTRKGTAVFLDDILNDTRDSMHAVMKQSEDRYAKMENPEEIADTIGVSAIVVQDMAAKRIKNYSFDWQRMFSFEGDTGPYLQYAHVRLCSIERNATVKVNPEADISLLTEKPAIDLIEEIARFPDVVINARNGFEPCTIVVYALKLSHAVSSALEALWVVGQEEPVAEARLLLYWAARQTLNNALRLIGLKPLEHM